MRIGGKRQVTRTVDHDLVVHLNIFGSKLQSVPLTSFTTGVVSTYACLNKRNAMQSQREFIEHPLE